MGATEPFEVFYAAYYPRAVRYATRLVGRTSAEDVAQRVMERMWLRYDRVDPNRPVWNLVLVATRHECIESHRRRTKRELVDLATVEAYLTTGVDTTERTALARDDWRRMARALLALAPDDRQLLVEHVWYGVSLAELARRRGIKENAMRQRFRRLRDRLRRTLDGPSDARPDAVL